MWKRLLLSIGLIVGFSAASITTQSTTVTALGSCAAWKINGIGGGQWRGGQSRCSGCCNPPGQGIQRVIVYCSNGVFKKGAYVGVGATSTANCVAPAYAVSVWEDAP